MQSHYLNQCWIILNWTNKLQWNFDKKIKLFHLRKCIWKYRLRMAILSGGWVKKSKTKLTTMRYGEHSSYPCSIREIYHKTEIWMCFHTVLRHRELNNTNIHLAGDIFTGFTKNLRRSCWLTQCTNAVLPLLRYKTVSRSSHLYNGNPFTGKTTSSYWIGPLVCVSIVRISCRRLIARLRWLRCVTNGFTAVLH